MPHLDFETVSPAAELTRFNRAAVSALRLVPGMREVDTSENVLLAVQGTTWTVLGYGASQLLRLATQLVLARALLGPEAFGLVALVMVFLSGLDLLSDIGIGTDVVQHARGDDPVFLNTAFLIQAGRGLVLSAVAMALALPFAAFYHEPALRWLIIVASLSVALRGFSSPSIWTMTRHVQLRKLTGLTVGSDGAGFIVAVAWAVVSPTAWALVMGRVVSTAAYMIGSQVLAERRVSSVWDRRAAREILLFGAGIFVSSSTYFLSTEAERLVLGKFITLAELGCFSLALALSRAPSRGFISVVEQVFYPLFAKEAHKDPYVAAQKFRKARYLLLLAGLCIGCGAIILGKPIVALLLGPRYADAGWMLQLLGFAAALEIFSAASAQSLFAVGISRYSAYANLCKFFFLAVGLTIAFTWYGVYAAVWVVALAQLANYLPYLWGIRKYFAPMLQTEITCLAILLAGSAFAAWLTMVGF